MHSTVILVLFCCLWMMTDLIESSNYTEKELDDFEHTLIQKLEKYRKTSPKDYTGICSRNPTAIQWKKINNECIRISTENATQEVKDEIMKLQSHCEIKIPDQPGCDEIFWNKRGACVMSYYEDHRKVILSSSKAGMDPKGIEKFYGCYEDFGTKKEWKF